MFRVGQKVVCISTWVRGNGGFGDEVGPISGEIYTIREIGMGLNPLFPDVPQVRLVEIENPDRVYRAGRYEASFGAFRFRPVVERKTNISFAHDILRKINGSVDA